ncbi:MAG: trypco2 family protein [Paracoccaceae bacterium]|nr:trypco2 family protein [Paracoccaceae bacterium]
MDLKEFIKETISGIVDATAELQSEYDEMGILINPPVSNSERDLFEEGSIDHTYRRVESVEFDVAVTATNETSGGGKAGLKILSMEAGARGDHLRSNEEISRVKFSIPIALAPSSAEGRSREARERLIQNTDALVNRKSSRSSIA